MELLKLHNFIAKVIEIFAMVSLAVGVIFLFVAMLNSNGFVAYLGAGIGGIVNGVFMYGFAYVVEACAIHIEKYWEENTEVENVEVTE